MIDSIKKLGKYLTSGVGNTKHSTMCCERIAIPHDEFIVLSRRLSNASKMFDSVTVSVIDGSATALDSSLYNFVFTITGPIESLHLFTKYMNEVQYGQE